VATLSQVYDQLTRRQVAQIDLAPNYEHKHQELSPDDTSKGLHRMVVDIAKFYLTYMRSHGVPLDDSYVDMLLHTYYQTALKYIRKYSYDADVNDLRFDLYEEESAASHFRGFLWDAWMQSKGPQEAKLIPSWNRVAYTFPRSTSGCWRRWRRTTVPRRPARLSCAASRGGGRSAPRSGCGGPTPPFRFLSPLRRVVVPVSPQQLERKRFLLYQLPYLVLYIVALGLVAMTAHDATGMSDYWQMFIPLVALVSILGGWRWAGATGSARWGYILRQVLHWGALVLVIQLLFAHAVQDFLNDQQDAFVSVYLIGLAALLSLYLDWKMALFGVFLC
jgi:hypothetical protein